MRSFQAALIGSAIVVSAGCYHATIETGATPSTQVIDQTFASSWVYGLVPPKIVQTASRCPNGVARVETQHTFVNQLVGFLTLGIYTPMRITVTCAAASASAIPSTTDVVLARSTRSGAAAASAVSSAARRSLAMRRPVYVRF